MQEIRVGLIGCGPMGRDLITHAHSITPKIATVAAVCDVQEDLAQSTAAMVAAEPMTDAEALIARDDVGAVFVATPGFLHKEVVISAASAGKHVFVEKPMALSSDDCLEMIAAASANNVKLMVGQVLRYIDVFRFTLDHIEAGDLGEVFSVRITRTGGGWGSWSRSWRSRMDQCGGVLFEFSVHELDFMRCCLGNADRVYAVASKRVEFENDYPDTCFVSIEFEGGGIGQLAAGMADKLGTYRGEILGTEGAIHFNKSMGRIRYRFGGATDQADEVELSIGEMDYPSPVAREVGEFINAVSKGHDVTIPGEDGLSVVTIAEAANRSWQSGQVIHINS